MPHIDDFKVTSRSDPSPWPVGRLATDFRLVICGLSASELSMALSSSGSNRTSDKELKTSEELLTLKPLKSFPTHFEAPAESACGSS